MMEIKKLGSFPVDWQGGTMSCHLEDASTMKEPGKPMPQELHCIRLGVDARVKLPNVDVDVYHMEKARVSVCYKSGEMFGHNCETIEIDDPKEFIGVYYRDLSGVEVNINNRTDSDGDGVEDWRDCDPDDPDKQDDAEDQMMSAWAGIEKARQGRKALPPTDEPWLLEPGYERKEGRIVKKQRVYE